MNKLYLYFFIIVTLFGCKNGKEKTKEHQITGPVEVERNQYTHSEEDYFTLKLEAIVERDDTFTLFYLNEGQDKISKKNSISINVTGGNYFQTLIFKLNSNVLPTRLILKFVNQEKTQTITINKVDILYNGNEIAIAKQDFFNYFNPNKFINYNKENFTAVAVEKEGEFKPYFVSRKTLEDRIFLYLP